VGGRVVILTESDPGRIMVTQKADEAYLPECIVSSFHSRQDALLVWAGVAQGAKGPIVRLKTMPYTVTSSGQKRGGGLSAQGYAEQVVSGPLKDFWSDLTKERGREILVVEDGAGPHKGKVVQTVRDRLGMKRLTHPPNSPDLNPIEPLWFLLKKRVAKIPGHHNNLDSLWAPVLKAWDSITIEEVNKHTSPSGKSGFFITHQVFISSDFTKFL
jgi:transposase